MGRFKKIWFKPAAGLLGLALLSAAPFLQAQQQPDSNARAARLSFVDGEVQITQGNQILANPALANTPLFEGAVVSTREDGRAEVQFDNGTVVRVAPNSSLKISVLRQQDNVTVAELHLDAGLAYFEMQGDSTSGRTTARFGDSAVTASGFTVFRLNVDNPPGEVAVFSGNAHLERGNNLSLDLHGGESVALNGSDSNLYNMAETIEPDSWDAWNADRDQQLNSEQASRTAASSSEPNSNNPAWGDLDTNGNWYNVPGQGYVWSPYEASSGDWDPYGCGNWVWTPGYGYVWVSCESWGYLPYSMGYWNYYDDFGWGWTPGYGYPWWATGGWGWNIGTRPPRYLPPHRPRGGPVQPVAPIRRGGGFYQPNPVIAVNRIPSSPTAHPVHVVGRATTIGGSMVEPLRPLSPRPSYEHTGAVANGFTGGSYRVTGGQNAPRYPGYVPWTNSGVGRPGTMPAAPGGGYRPPAPSRGYSGGGAPVSHPSGGGAPHVSGGGGGGGGGHPSGGGGGGGGGGHPSGGGGGGHH